MSNEGNQPATVARPWIIAAALGVVGIFLVVEMTLDVEKRISDAGFGIGLLPSAFLLVFGIQMAIMSLSMVISKRSDIQIGKVAMRLNAAAVIALIMGGMLAGKINDLPHIVIALAFVAALVPYALGKR